MYPIGGNVGCEKEFDKIFAEELRSVAEQVEGDFGSGKMTTSAELPGLLMVRLKRYGPGEACINAKKGSTAKRHLRLCRVTNFGRPWSRI